MPNYEVISYSILSSSWKRGKLKEIQAKMTARQVKSVTPVEPASTGCATKKDQCPCCKKYTLQIVCTFTGRGPPKHWLKKIAVYKKQKSLKVN